MGLGTEPGIDGLDADQPRACTVAPSFKTRRQAQVWKGEEERGGPPSRHDSAQLIS